jgi:hypothetical protein
LLHSVASKLDHEDGDKNVLNLCAAKVNRRRRRSGGGTANGKAADLEASVRKGHKEYVDGRQLGRWQSLEDMVDWIVRPVTGVHVGPDQSAA